MKGEQEAVDKYNELGKLERIICEQRRHKRNLNKQAKL